MVLNRLIHNFKRIPRHYKILFGGQFVITIFLMEYRRRCVHEINSNEELRKRLLAMANNDYDDKENNDVNVNSTKANINDDDPTNHRQQ